MALLHVLSNIIKPAQNPVAVPRESTAPNYPLNAPNMVKYQQKQLEMSHLLEQVQEGSLKEVVIIDSMQRFGMDHYFEDQITQTLTQQYKHSQTLLYSSDHDLYAASLRFQLLRQHGFHVPADVFNRFKGENLKFKNALSEDIRGLMSLHEASHLCIEDDKDILDEAFLFSTNFLTARLPHLDDFHASMVQNTLNYPYHKSLARFTKINYLKTHNLEKDWEKLLADLTRMDFNVMQCIYREEIHQVFKWWKELGLSEELKLARNQPLKWYLWSVAMVTNPTLSRQRIEITKPISLVYIVDDIFDVYGTLDELILFTEAINRWEVADKLPSYMKMCFKVIQDTTHEISNVVYQEFGWNPIDHLKKAWASLCNAFLTEAKWFASGHSPRAEEYLKNGITSSGIPMVLTNLFFLLGYGESTGTTDVEGIISSVAAILRLLDDLGTAEDEEQEGNDGSYMEYYMKEQQGWSLSDGRQHVLDKVSKEWKLLNKHCLSPTTIPTSFKTACLNVARLVPMMYAYNDNHRLPVLEEHVKFMFSHNKEDLMW
ncbi:(3S,6E)-nerolidol synthase 1-like [Ipomoea triloba]|uniref:(3S,6E)-nerolidol synthase 1-like n=1 Tax=Ipomoea triloba TaxID=35885 RepID=UPI00125D2841|nr:(3S,6E)-nerolidol synthase 1-like [Ipomoea triloba]